MSVRVGGIVRIAYNGALSNAYGVVVEIYTNGNKIRWARVDFPMQNQQSFYIRYLKVVGHVDE